MNFFHELLFVGLVPLAVAAGVAWVVRRMQLPPQICWSAGVGFGYASGHFIAASRAGVARGFWSLVEPREASDWLPLAVLLALGVTILASFTSRRLWPALLGLAAIVAVGVPARLLAGPLAQQWSVVEKISHLALLGATLALVWLLLATARDEKLPRIRQELLVLAAVGAAIVSTLSGSFALGRLCGVVAAAVAGTALISPRGLSGAAGVVTVSLGGLIIVGVYYAKLHPANAALVLLSIIAAAGRLPEFAGAWPPWRLGLLRAVLCLTTLGIALAGGLA